MDVIPFEKLKVFFDAQGAEYPAWRELETEAGKYLK